MRTTVLNIIFFSLPSTLVLAKSECVKIKNPVETNSTSKFNIDQPGHYCLVENLHARVGLAHHSPELRLIYIRSSNVILDLKHSILGRGTLFKNPGGIGIEIASGIQNITVKNGTIQDFDTGLYRGVEPFIWGSKNKTVEPTYNSEIKAYFYERDNITITNVHFSNNKIKINVEERD